MFAKEVNTYFIYNNSIIRIKGLVWSHMSETKKHPNSECCAAVGISLIFWQNDCTVHFFVRGLQKVPLFKTLSSMMKSEKEKHHYQILEGLTTLDLSKHVCQQACLSEEIINALKFENTIDEDIGNYLLHFLRNCDKELLQGFLLFTTGCKSIHIYSRITVKTEISNAIFGRTCMCTLVIPSSFSNNAEFEVAMKTALISHGKSFTVV